MNPGEQDWHPAQIVCALRMAGWSLRKLALAHGYAEPTTLNSALRKPWPKAEKIIADAVGVEPDEIWPTRYENGKSNRRAGRPRVNKQ